MSFDFQMYQLLPPKVTMTSTEKKNGGAIPGFLYCLIPALGEESKFERQ